ncbi:ABC transporter substrate-binding protein [Pseudoxanthobacter sp. M-2]|uniref:ABC transporter substrate-binding protein n=1 Tax=Pseudoxanthobacter sp. M-2 TaxID=3078754 RepID=UPI0038FD3AA8
MTFRTLLLGAAGACILAGSAAAQGFQNDGVKIGVLTDMSGTYSDIAGQGSVVAAQMAIEDFGKPLNGKTVEVVSADHQNKADISSATARQWYDAEGVDAIFDLVTSATALAVREVARERGKIDMVSGAATTALTGKACSPTGFHWAYDTAALANGTGGATVKNGGDTWFFITADYAFGHALEADTSAVIEKDGGKVLGAVRHPFPNSDFSSFLLQAQASGAKVIGLANAGQDTTNAIKQAAEFGIVESGQSLASLLMFISDVHSLGLPAAQGLLLTTGYYWDLDDESRPFAQRFFEKTGKMPTMVHAGVYSSVLHYLKAVDAAGTDDGKTVAAKMHEMPVDDFFARNGELRVDGRLVHDMYLARVKKPEQSTKPWDYFEIVATIPGDQAYKPLSTDCPLVTQ